MKQKRLRELREKSDNLGYQATARDDCLPLKDEF